jgi:hypothetical protein
VVKADQKAFNTQQQIKIPNAQFKGIHRTDSAPSPYPYPKQNRHRKICHLILGAIVNLFNPNVNKLSHVKLVYFLIAELLRSTTRLCAHLAATILMAPPFGFLDHFGRAMCSCKFVN